MITREVAVIRARMLRVTRSFFDGRGYTEVDTPLLAPRLIPEPYIDPFMTTFQHPRQDGVALGLVPSPEVWMKELLAQGFGNIYQLGHVFRNGENLTPIHNSEFTMLEWYTVDADSADSLAHTNDLLGRLADALGDDVDSERRFIGTSSPEIVSMAEAFRAHVGSDIDWFHEPDGMRRAAERSGLAVSSNESDEELFQRVFLSRVEPALPRDRCVYLTDYPALVPTLAARRPDERFADRWELYIAGMEIANCYNEERSPERLEAYLDTAERMRSARADAVLGDLEPAPLSGFSGAPQCSGVAMGIDRLLAAFLGYGSIRGVIFFPGFSIFR